MALQHQFVEKETYTEDEYFAFEQTAFGRWKFVDVKFDRKRKDMTLTINLPEETLASLRADAGAQGRSTEEVAAERLAALYANADNDETAAVEEALAELERGQSRPFAAFADEFSARFDARYGTA